eukprot:3666123-Pyramimonas_sp.AAC.1
MKCCQKASKAESVSTSTSPGGEGYKVAVVSWVEKMKFGTQHLVVIGAVLVLFALAVVVREEVFVEKTDIKAEQRAAFEATEAQKHAAEAAYKSNPPAGGAPQSKKPSSLTQAEKDAMVPDWLISGKPAKPSAQVKPPGVKRTPKENLPP